MTDDMPADVFSQKLTNLNACSDGMAFVRGKSLRESWESFERPDWMLWLLGRSTVSKKVIATIAVEFAETMAHHAAAYPAVAECIAVVKRFLMGEANREELSAAESAAWSARSAAGSAAWSAAWKQQCEIIRKHVPADEIVKLFV